MQIDAAIKSKMTVAAWSSSLVLVVECVDSTTNVYPYPQRSHLDRERR
jgi:hypothetical protein